MLPAGFGCNVLATLPVPVSLSQILFGQKVDALLHSLLGVAAKAQATQPAAAADQLLVNPSHADHARLPLDGQVDVGD